MPFTSAALAMSTRSRPPEDGRLRRRLQHGAPRRAPPAAASWREAPTAQPTQLRKVRCASWSTASLQPREGCVATKCASERVTGGASWSAATCVLRAIAQFSREMWRSLASVLQRVMSAWMKRPNSSGRHGHRLQGLAGQPLAQRRVGERLVDLLVQLLRDRLGHVRRAHDAVPLHAVEALVAQTPRRWARRAAAGGASGR